MDVEYENNQREIMAALLHFIRNQLRWFYNQQHCVTDGPTWQLDRYENRIYFYYYNGEISGGEEKRNITIQVRNGKNR